MSLINKLFASKEKQFQQKAIGVVRNAYPDISFQEDLSANSISVAGHSFDIGDLRSRCLLNEIDSPSIIQQFFSHAVALAAQPPAMSWEEAKTGLKPQIVPTIYMSDLQVVHQALALGIEVCFVLGPDGGFIRSSALNDWRVSQEDLMAIAVENLGAEPFEMEVTVTEGTDRFIGLENDPFSAARILLPQVRNMAAEKLGDTYLAGLPNRNFLILWSSKCSQRFQDYAEEKIQNDFSLEPFPISSATYLCTPSGMKLRDKYNAECFILYFLLDLEPDFVLLSSREGYHAAE